MAPDEGIAQRLVCVFPMQARKMSTRLCHAVGLLFIVDGLLFQLDVLCAYLGHLQ